MTTVMMSEMVMMVVVMMLMLMLMVMMVTTRARLSSNRYLEIRYGNLCVISYEGPYADSANAQVKHAQ